MLHLVGALPEMPGQFLRLRPKSAPQVNDRAKNEMNPRKQAHWPAAAPSAKPTSLRTMNREGFYSNPKFPGLSKYSHILVTVFSSQVKAFSMIP